MLSRGVSRDKFGDKLDFWSKGPDWIRHDTVQWPISEFGCLSEARKTLVMCTEQGKNGNLSLLLCPLTDSLILLNC